MPTAVTGIRDRLKESRADLNPEPEQCLLLPSPGEAKPSALPQHGGIGEFMEDFAIAVGNYAAVGRPLMTFIAAEPATVHCTFRIDFNPWFD